MSEDQATRFVEVPEWPRPKGFSNGVITGKKTLYVAGQVGWNAKQEFERHDFAGTSSDISNDDNIGSGAGD